MTGKWFDNHWKPFKPIAFDDWNEKDRIRKRRIIDKIQHPYYYSYSPTYFIPRSLSLRDKGFKCRKISKDGKNIFVPTFYNKGNVAFSKTGYNNDMTYSECQYLLDDDNNNIKYCKKGTNDIECQSFFI